MALGLREIVRRMGYHQPTSRTIEVFEDIRHRFIELALYLDEELPESRDKVRCQDALEDALTRAIASVARKAGPGEDPLPREMPPGHGETPAG
jgi:hypothetical protein